jgi:N-acetylglutamate synthase-like GNAT family acetyltransferase
VCYIAVCSFFDIRIQKGEKPMMRVIEYTDEYREKVVVFMDDMESKVRGKSTSIDMSKYPPEYFRKDEASGFWVAIDENRDVVGTVSVENCGGGIGYLRCFYVRADLRQGRIGGRLALTLMAFIKRHNYRHLFSATMPQNTEIHRFHQKHGFERVVSPPPTNKTFHPQTVFFQIDLM